eukprot:10382_6
MARRKFSLVTKPVCIRLARQAGERRQSNDTKSNKITLLLLSLNLMKARICKTCSRGSCSYHSCGVLLKAVRSARDAVMEPSRVLRTAPASLGSESVGTLAAKGPSLLFESRDMRPACRSAPESIILGGSKCPSPNNDLFSNIVLTSS